MLWSCIVSFVLIALFSLTGGKVVTYILILLFGLFMSGLFSIALVFANKLLVGAEESTPSLLIASGGVGGAVLPLIMGKTMDLGGAYASSWLLAGFLMLLALLSIFAVFIQRSRGSALAAAVSAESNG
ncbi:hypothetical protein HMSSN036_02370 [Paenibacillus macerans]|nr:hypothetical protein HMSSN036_02370 [Paenibacillus macerans]